MENKKYELTSEIKTFNGIKLHRIKALIDFGDVKAGDLGGYIQDERNLSQTGKAWVKGNALVNDNAVVGGNAVVRDNAVVTGNAWVEGNATVYDNAVVSGDAWVKDDAVVKGNAVVTDNAWISGNAVVESDTKVDGNAVVESAAWIDGNARVEGEAVVSSEADYVYVKSLGLRGRYTSFFKQKDGSIGVVCGCFCGTLEEFRKKVKETHKNTKFAEEYLMLANLIEFHFNKENK
ncbi:hypothetical protein [Bulleidia sp. zg-1006]|uniref:hypothetical protein n=1 Tax=Bulleidia sp. zg-1006 TaxID=2806552 RepID=UPI001939A7AF|nr:hypothetical protein [Bulleidia sp. zg-1006]QRG86082.1 hypothetical protein JOS54_04195 [Bulleidia sp. zg-1006]